MEKQYKKLQALFNGAKPTVPLFEAYLKTLSEKECEKQLQELCALAFGYYEQMRPAYQTFVKRYFEHDRSCYTDYLTQHTPLGDLRYHLLRPTLFLKMLHLLETTERRIPISYLHLAASLLTIFCYPFKLSTLSKYLRLNRHSPEELLQLIGSIEIYEGDGW
ncbi:MAG: hypothetical protein RR382_12160 [Tannerellaceae bacterium]